MERVQIWLEHKLDFLGMLKEALKLPFKHIRFIIFTFLSSLPFFCFLVFYDLILQKTFFQTSDFLGQSVYNYHFSYDDWAMSFEKTNRLPYTLFPKLIQLFILYLVPYYLLELLNMTIVVSMASKLCAGEKLFSLREMLKNPISKTGLKGPLITSLYVLLFSSSCLLGLIWVVTNCYILSGFFGSYFYSPYYYLDYGYYFSAGDTIVRVLIYVLHGVVFAGLLLKYMEWSAGWNMSIVMSIVEETYGSEALDMSSYYGRGSQWRGAILMLIFFAWALALRLPCVFGGCYVKMGGHLFTFLYTDLICVGNVMK